MRARQYALKLGARTAEFPPESGKVDCHMIACAVLQIQGHGTLTFHVAGLFRTPTGWNLWVGGSPNAAKDGIAPLGGVVETDWSPYTFTMNWQFTRPHHWVRFEEDEPFCHIFPVQRQAVEAVTPTFRSIDDEPSLKAQFDAWSASRNAFHRRMHDNPPSRPADKWQKLYYRGVDPRGATVIDDHQSKLNVAPFSENAGLADICPHADSPTERT
jgi:Family of unknown function (DUF6065)